MHGNEGWNGQFFDAKKVEFARTVRVRCNFEVLEVQRDFLSA